MARAMSGAVRDVLEPKARAVIIKPVSSHSLAVRVAALTGDFFIGDVERTGLSLELDAVGEGEARREARLGVAAGGEDNGEEFMAVMWCLVSGVVGAASDGWGRSIVERLGVVGRISSCRSISMGISMGETSSRCGGLGVDEASSSTDAMFASCREGEDVLEGEEGVE